MKQQKLQTQIEYELFVRDERMATKEIEVKPKKAYKKKNTYLRLLASVFTIG